MKAKSVPRTWLERDGRRLDCGPYMSGALEAKVLLEGLKARKDRLRDVTAGGLAGIFNGPRFARSYVDDPAHGVPFLGSTDILNADLTNLPRLSKKQVAANPRLLIRSGWTLITCSGTIGRMAYARPDMEGMAGSQHFMRVIPDAEKVPPGYLYAYLSSEFGVPLVVGGTYGAIIQHIEPHHLADLPVPRLGKEIEEEAHRLVIEASDLRTNAAGELQSAIKAVERKLRMPSVARGNDRTFGVSVANSVLRREMRFEAYYYNTRALAVDEWCLAHPNGYRMLGDVADVFDVPPFKHIYVQAEHGIAFFTSGDLFLLDRRPDKYLSRTRTRGLQKYVLEQGWVLLARSGQLGGILGRPQFADSALHRVCASDHVIRIVATEMPAGFLYAYLATQSVGYVLLTRTMTGASIPALWPSQLKGLRVVNAEAEFMALIHDQVTRAFEARVNATSREDAARELVENAIKGLS